MKKTALILLISVIAVSGCTQSISTEEDVREQTREINQHTEDVVEENTGPVTKIEILEIEATGYCGRGGKAESFVHSPRLFELGGIESFNNGRTLIINGIQEIEGEIDCRNVSYDPMRVSLDRVKFNKSVFQNGSVIATDNEFCQIYKSGDLDHRFEAYEFAEAMASQIYKECFNLEYRGDSQ